MILCTIAPILHLEETKDNAIHMALTHLCENPKYVNFMRQEHEDGKMIILDNSLIELGYAVPTTELLAAAAKVCADEIILPDAYKDAHLTVERAQQSIKEVRKDKSYAGRIMCVAHGKSVDEWAWCAKKLIELKIDTLGIPKVMCDILGGNGRKMCIRKLKRMFKGGEISYLPKLHLLGIWEDVLEVAEIERTQELAIRSVDSVIAFKFASFGMLFEDGGRPAGPVDFLTARCDSLVHTKNVIELRKLCRDNMDLVPVHDRVKIQTICSPAIDGNVAHVEFGSPQK